MGDSAPCLLHKDTDKLRVKASRLQPIDDCAFHSIEPRRKELLPKLLTHLINKCRSEIKPRHKSHQEEDTNEYRIVLPHIICKSKIAATCQILLMQKVDGEGGGCEPVDPAHMPQLNLTKKEEERQRGDNTQGLGIANESVNKSIIPHQGTPHTPEEDEGKQCG